MNPKVSVIVPVYNASKYLNKCIESLISQTLKEIEIILVDDGSTDDSKEIIKEYSKSDSRVKLILQENSGPSKARNSGIKEAKGVYIAFVDADDWVDSDTYNDMYNAAVQSNSDIVFTDILYEFDDTEKNFIKEYQINSNQPINKNMIRESILPDFLHKGSYGSVCKLFKRQFLYENNILFNEDRSLGEDWLLNMEAFTHCNVAYYIDKPYYHYRQSDNSSLMGKYRPELFELYINQSPLEEYFKKWGLFTEKVSIELAKRKCFVAVNGCIQNEFKKDCKNTVKQKIDNLSKIVNHPSVEEAVSITLEHERKFLKIVYLKMLERKNVIALFTMGKVLSLRN